MYMKPAYTIGILKTNFPTMTVVFSVSFLSREGDFCINQYCPLIDFFSVRFIKETVVVRIC